MNLPQHKRNHIFYLFFLNLGIIALLLFVLNRFTGLNFDLVLDSKWFFALGVFSLTASLVFREKYNSDRFHTSHFSESIFQVSPYFFLALLFVIAINQFFKIGFVTSRIFYISVLAICFGFLAFYKNRDRVEAELESEKESEATAEARRYHEFSHKFPRISKIWGLKHVVRWMYKEGWWYSGILVAIVVVGFVLRMYHVIGIYYNVDEAISGLAIRGFLTTGSPIMPSGFLYYREIMSTIIMSVVPSFFGVTELSLRIGTIFFGLATVILTYLIGSSFFDKKSGILGAFMISLLTIQISFSRWARMYSIFQFFATLSIFLIIKYYRTDRIRYFVSYIIVSFVAFFVHRSGAILFLLILPLAYLSIFNKYNLRKARILILLAGGFFILGILYLFRIHIYALFDKYVFGFAGDYVLFNLLSYIGTSYGILANSVGNTFVPLFFIGLLIIIAGRAFNKKNKYSFVISIFILPILIDLLIYSQGFAYRTRYIYFIIPFFVLVSLYSISNLSARFGKSKIIAMVLIIILILISSNLSYLPRAEYPIENRVEVSNSNIIALSQFLSTNPTARVCASPPETYAFYFAKSPDCWLVSHSGEIGLYSINGKQIYTNASIISSLEEFRDFESGKLIVLVEEDRWRFVDPSLRSFVMTNLSYKENLSNNLLSVYANF